MASAELLLHPVRWRVVQAFLGDRALTTSELRAELPDVPTPSLYRHVRLLADAGVLVVAERTGQVAGRRYRLDLATASVGGAEAAGMTIDEHRRAFGTFVTGLLADFDRYLAATPAGTGPDLARDGVGYRQVAVWVTDDEFADLVAELRAALQARMGQAPGEGRRRRMVSTVHLPAD